MNGLFYQVSVRCLSATDGSYWSIMANLKCPYIGHTWSPFQEQFCATVQSKRCDWFCTRTECLTSLTSDIFSPVLMKWSKCAVSGIDEASAGIYLFPELQLLCHPTEEGRREVSQPLSNLETLFTQEVSACLLQSTSTSWCIQVSDSLGKVNQLHLQTDKQCFVHSRPLKVHPECASTHLLTSDKQDILCILSLWTQYCSISK